jgi:hypothetical protein
VNLAGFDFASFGVRHAQARFIPVSAGMAARLPAAGSLSSCHAKYFYGMEDFISDFRLTG